MRPAKTESIANALWQDITNLKAQLQQAVRQFKQDRAPHLEVLLESYWSEWFRCYHNSLNLAGPARNVNPLAMTQVIREQQSESGMCLLTGDIPYKGCCNGCQTQPRTPAALPLCQNKGSRVPVDQGAAAAWLPYQPEAPAPAAAGP